MTLKIQQFILGPIQNNSFLIIDEELKTCAVVDPPFGSEKILEFINDHNLTLKMILITHAHFDHIGGVNLLIPPPPNSIQLYMHPDDQVLWEMGGGAAQFGFSIDQPGIQPTPVPINRRSVSADPGSSFCIHQVIRQAMSPFTFLKSRRFFVVT